MTDTRDGEAAPRRGQDERRAARRDEERPRRDKRQSSRQRDDDAGGERSEDDRDRAEAGRAEEERGRPRLRASEVAQTARHEIHELTGRQIEGVTFVQRGDDGWRVGVEVVESHRIPDTTDILAVYEADIDDSGELTGYRRTERYARGKG